MHPEAQKAFEDSLKAVHALLKIFPDKGMKDTPTFEYNNAIATVTIFLEKKLGIYEYLA